MEKKKLSVEQKEALKKKLALEKRKESERKFEKKRLEKIEAMKQKLNDLAKKKFVPKESKTKVLTKAKFDSALELLATESEEMRNSTPTIERIAKWTMSVEPLLMAVIATAKEAKDKAIEDMDSPKDKRLFRRLIDKVEKTGLKAKDFLPAIKAQQNRIANLVEDLDISKYLTK